MASLVPRVGSSLRRLCAKVPFHTRSLHYSRPVQSSKTCSLISIPISIGQPKDGADDAPRVLKEAGLLNLLEFKLGWSVKQLPDITATTSTSDTNKDPSQTLALVTAKNCAQVGSTCEEVYKGVYEQAKTDNFVLIHGGDHCIPIGTISGIVNARPNTGVIWVDAHADLNTPVASNSGNMHGMPLGFLTGLVEDAQRYPSMDWFKPCLGFKDIVYIGLRDLDTFEKEMIKKHNIKAYTMYDIDQLGIGKVMDEINEYFSTKDNLHLSYDIDALDPMFAPHTGTAVRGGLTFREGNFICKYLHNTGKMTSMELVEINPLLRPDVDKNQTVDMAMALLGSTMGEKVLLANTISSANQIQCTAINKLLHDNSVRVMLR